MKFPWAYKNNKVICISDDWGDWSKYQIDGISFPEYRKIYTIRDIRVHGEKLGLMFDEIINSSSMLLDDELGNYTIGEISFDASQFKPLEKKTIEEDISMFNKLTSKMLDKVY